MTEVRPQQKLLIPVLGMVAYAIAARLGAPLLLGLLLLPLFAELMADYAGIPGAATLCLAAGVATGLTLPVSLLPLVVFWCGGAIAASCIPVKNGISRILLWGGVCVGTWIIALVLLWNRTDGQVIPGLARMMTDIIESSPERDSFLLNAYSMGLARLEGTAALIPAIRVMGSVVIEPATRMQLLWSLRVSLEMTLPNLLCDGIVFQTVLTALLPVLASDTRRRRRGEKGLLPPPEKWYIPRKTGLLVLLLGLGGLVPLLSDGGVDTYMGMMGYAIFRIAFILQGVCLLLWMEKRMGMRSVARNIWAVVLSVIIPIIPLIMGMVDQSRDARHLRPNKEAGQE